MKYKIVCENCGNDNLEFNACGYWDSHEEDYEWFSIEAYCDQCGCPVPAKKVEITNTLENYIKEGIKSGHSTNIEANKD